MGIDVHSALPYICRGISKMAYYGRNSDSIADTACGHGFRLGFRLFYESRDARTVSKTVARLCFGRDGGRGGMVAADARHRNGKRVACGYGAAGRFCLSAAHRLCHAAHPPQRRTRRAAEPTFAHHNAGACKTRNNTCWPSECLDEL